MLCSAHAKVTDSTSFWRCQVATLAHVGWSAYVCSVSSLTQIEAIYRRRNPHKLSNVEAADWNATAARCIGTMSQYSHRSYTLASCFSAQVAKTITQA